MVAFIDLPFALIFMVVIGWISWLMLIPLCVGAVIMLLYALAVQGRMHELAEITYRAGAQRNATLIEGLGGFETLKALAAEAPIQRKWEKSAALLARVGAQLRLLSSTASNAWAALSAREAQVARTVLAGRSNKEVAAQLFISERTVKAHLGAVFEKLGVRDRLQLVLRLAASAPPLPSTTTETLT